MPRNQRRILDVGGGCACPPRSTPYPATSAPKRIKSLFQYVDELREQLDEINEVVRLDADDYDLLTPRVPEAELDQPPGVPLVDSRWSFAEQTDRLLRCKRYGATDANGHGEGGTR